MIRIYYTSLNIGADFDIFDKNDAIGLNAKIKKSSVFRQKFQIFVKESDVIPSYMVLELGQCKLFLEFVNPDPGKQAHFRNFVSLYFIIKINVDLLCFPFGSCRAYPIR